VLFQPNAVINRLMKDSSYQDSYKRVTDIVIGNLSSDPHLFLWLDLKYED
jgi:hypothetical protein